jgi:anti-sigma factor RsiW
MSDVQAKLVAWLDGELPSDEVVGVERHIEECKECRDRLAAYEKVSEIFDVYCDVVVAAKKHGRVSLWVPVLAGAAVATAMIFLAFPRARIEAPSIATPAIKAASVPVPAPPMPEPAPRKTIRKRHAVAPVQEQIVRWQPAEAAVQIAIPAEAMFPPGAMPEGMNFIAELSIAPDGSVKQVRVRQ